MTEAVALSGAQKAAALLIALGREASARVLARLPAEAVERIALELMRTPALAAPVRDAILQEAYTGLFGEGGVLPGGEQFALEVMSEAYGPEKAQELLSQILERQVVLPFEFLRGVDPAQAREFLAGEHPQTIALVLAHLDPRTAARILVELDPPLQVEVARRIALTEQTSPEAVAVVEEELRRRMASLVTGTSKQAGGARPLAHVLNQVDRSTERQILGALAEQDPALADEVRRFMFVFEDIVLIDDRSMQRIIRELDTKDIALALRTTSEEVRQKFFSNMSQRAAEMLREEMALTGQVRLKAVEEAQGRIVEVIKRLEEQDEIVINRGGADDVLV